MKPIVLLLALLASSASAQFQAQNGWGLPRQVAQSAVTQGVVVDAPRERLVYADQDGIVAVGLDGSSRQMLMQQTGVRALSGFGGGDSLALAWYARSLTDTNAAWGWYKGQARKLLETEDQNVAVASLNGAPLFAYVGSEGEQTVIYLQRWNAPKTVAYRTNLNVGALTLNATAGGTVGVFFAEGYRNAQDEKYDAVLLTGKLEGRLERTRVGAAVYTGREQRYALAAEGERLTPVWWFETDEEQRAAALTKRHNPRFAVWDGSRVREFAPPGEVMGQVGGALYYKLGTDIRALDLQTWQSTPQMIAPRGISAAGVARGNGASFAAWQSIEGDGFASTLWVADTRTPYQPTTLDRISVAFGWNPWYAAQSALAQTIIAMLFAAGAVMLTAPLVWLVSTQAKRRVSLWIAAGVGAAFVVGSRFLSGSVSAPGWSLEALLTPPWWTALLGIAVGVGLVWAFRRRLSNTELSPTIASSLVVLSGVFVMVFSKAGFLRF
jgi:hypothetical protein